MSIEPKTLWGVFHWQRSGLYTATNAVRVYKTQRGAQRAADRLNDKAWRERAEVDYVVRPMRQELPYIRTW